MYAIVGLVLYLEFVFSVVLALEVSTIRLFDRIGFCVVVGVDF